MVASSMGVYELSHICSNSFVLFLGLMYRRLDLLRLRFAWVSRPLYLLISEWFQVDKCFSSLLRRYCLLSTVYNEEPHVHVLGDWPMWKWLGRRLNKAVAKLLLNIDVLYVLGHDGRTRPGWKYWTQRTQGKPLFTLAFFSGLGKEERSNFTWNEPHAIVRGD